VRLVASIFDATALHVRKLRSCLLGLGLAVARHVSDTSRLSVQLVTARWCGGGSVEFVEVQRCVE